MENRFCRSSTLPSIVNENTLDVEGITLYARKTHCHPLKRLSLHTSRTFVHNQGGKLRDHEYLDVRVWRDAPCGTLSAGTINIPGVSPLKAFSIAHSISKNVLLELQRNSPGGHASDLKIEVLFLP